MAAARAGVAHAARRQPGTARADASGADREQLGGCCQPQSPSLAVLGTMNSSVVGLAQQCTSQSLQLMVQLRRERRRQPTLWSFQQQRQAARQDAAGSAQHLQLRNLMTLTSQFHGQMLGGSQSSPRQVGTRVLSVFVTKAFGCVFA